VPAGFGFAAQRVIPTLRHAGDLNALRGFLAAANAYALGTGAAIAAAAIVLIDWFPDTFRSQGAMVLIMAATTLPPHGLANVQDGVARTFG
ncbi:hypothetical protein J8J40_27580, partial [Mycobacterium tuberculosis]|nr:hypothetical protein [Mycobacterium tuberculosis]